MAVQDLTNAITEKVTTAATQNGSNQILITMSRSEISSALEASQVEENQPVLFEKIVSDLK